ncbi:MAG TPA: glycosyltransferase [Blastocatellia bacterium]|nr:glycosyltransferase [Blastocatellia bacterium]
MSEEIEVSVVVGTWNRCRLLESALESLLRQKADGISYEVIVVDNNSTDETRRLVESLIAEGETRLRYLFEREQGISWARNRGIREARGAIVAFTDDDVQVSPDWVACIKQAFGEHPDAACVGGKVLPEWDGKPPAWLTRAHWAPLGIQDYGDQPLKFSQNDPRCLIGANLAFRREVLQQCGGFRAELQRVRDSIGSLEDHELLLRLYRQGHCSWYVPQMIVPGKVSADRLTRTYHRRWHSGHGRFAALIRLEESFSQDGRLLAAPVAAESFLGAPLFIYRLLLRAALEYVAAVLRWQADVSFARELRVRELLGYISARRHLEPKHRQKNISQGVKAALRVLRLFVAHSL